jgi:hypothetical protein
MTPTQIQTCEDWAIIAAEHERAQQEADDLTAAIHAAKITGALGEQEAKIINTRLHGCFATLRRLERRSAQLGQLLPRRGPKAERIRQLERENYQLRRRLGMMEGEAA